MKLSVIIPCLNEGAVLGETLAALQGLRAAGHELVVVDGGSSDDTLAYARRLADQCLQTPPGRALQMNAGAAAARGEVLWFIHADSLPAPAAAASVLQAMAAGHDWGRCTVRLSGTHPAFRVIERMMNLRSCLSGIATGDQGIFVQRARFEAVGGYPAIPLMEDVALCKALRRQRRPACLRARIVTASRRWEQRGIAATVLLMWRLRLAYFLGASPQRLARVYRPCSSPTVES